MTYTSISINPLPIRLCLTLLATLRLIPLTSIGIAKTNSFWAGFALPCPRHFLHRLSPVIRLLTYGLIYNPHFLLLPEHDKLISGVNSKLQPRDLLLALTTFRNSDQSLTSLPSLAPLFQMLIWLCLPLLVSALTTTPLS
jgi:hypothetical protein